MIGPPGDQTAGEGQGPGAGGGVVEFLVSGVSLFFQRDPGIWNLTEEFLLQFQWKQNAPVGVVWGTKSDLC